MSALTAFSQLPFSLLHQWAYWIIFLAAFLEALPLIGTVVPGHSLVLFGGFLVRMHILDMGDLIVVSSFAAVAGDFIGYEIGRRYGEDFITRYGHYIFVQKEHLEKTKQLMHEHPGKALIVGRFNLVTRAIAPFVAGTARLSFSRFVLYNIIGGVSWAASSVLIGYAFGASYEIAAKYIGRAIFITVVVVLLLSYSYHYFNKKRHFFERYHVYAVVACVLALYVFGKMTEDVIDGESITHADTWVNQHIGKIQSPGLTTWMIHITNIMTPLHMLLLAGVLGIFFVLRKRWYHVSLLVCGLGGGLLIEAVIKLLVHRSRPSLPLVSVTGYSFPSGHATIATIFFALIIYAFRRAMPSRVWQWFFTAVNVALFILIGFSRIYLGVHWLSDVLAGFGLGIFWLTFLVLVFRVAGAYMRSVKQKQPPPLSFNGRM